MDTQALITELEQSCKTVRLSSFRSAPADIDIFVPPEQAEKAREYLLKEGFVLTRDCPQQRVGRRFEGGELYVLDCISDFNIYTDYIPSLKLSSKGNEILGNSEVLHACFKALCFNNQHKLAHLQQHQEALISFLKDETHFDCFPVRLRNNLHLSLEEIFLLLALLSRFSRIYGQLRFRLKALGKGSSLAFVGPDGSGKSFIIDKLLAIGPTYKIYMGDWFYALQRLYTFIVKTIPSPWNRFLYGIYFLENLLRRARVGVLRFLGHIVLIDRFPGTNRNLKNKGFLFWLNRITLRCFAKPDYLIFLYASPEVIHQRKQELSIEEIHELQERLHQILEGTRYTVLNTEKLDETLNSLLSMAYRRRNKS